MAICDEAKQCSTCHGNRSHQPGCPELNDKTPLPGADPNCKDCLGSGIMGGPNGYYAERGKPCGCTYCPVRSNDPDIGEQFPCQEPRGHKGNHKYTIEWTDDGVCI